MDFYIGSYTRLGGPGVGICHLEGNQLSLQASDFLPNATYVILNRAENRLFAVCNETVAGEAGTSLASYAVEGRKLTRLSRCDGKGIGPCHLCLSPDERFLYAANYHSGTISVFALDERGIIEMLVDHVVHEGHSINPQRQAGPHVHQVSFLPGTNLLCAVDLGLDQVILYEQNPETGLLTKHSATEIVPGMGPRHVVHGENGFTYLTCEMGNHVVALRFNGNGFDVLQYLPTLPEHFTGESATAAIRMTADGKKVLVSNRGHDSLAVFSVGGDGLLTPAGIYSTGDRNPRDFNLLKGGRVLIAHQEGDLVLSQWTGDGLEELQRLDVTAAVCVTLPRGEQG